MISLVCGSANAEFYPTQDVKPIVLMLIDSSGSMEYDVTGYGSETGDNDIAAVPPCTDTYQIGFGYRKSRFVVAQEVIAGTYKNYWCSYDDRSSPPSREDKDYPVKHIIPKSHGYALPEQNPDGLIDLNIDRFKFGLMTFDTDPGVGSGKGGGYSYGNESPVNYGARNHNAPTGQFVKPSHSDDNATVLLKNLEVQSALLNAIPFGGTPVSPMLQDAKHFFLTDDDFLPFNQNNGKGDPYYECRSKNIILITDGRANLGENADGYPYSIVSADQLYNIGVKVYVVGYQLSP
ncbi:MAG: hypothetical protein FJ088_10625, partial [Deltaproteobacteria bacterium]|nr:hypothetical protein [Deltaproteobacteria bacterium]